jgi:DNA-binding phage protein
VKRINKSAYLIKTDDDITIIDKYLSTCFEKEERYFLVNITDQPNRHSGMSTLSIDSWMDNI